MTSPRARTWSSPTVTRVAALATSKMAGFEDSHGFSHALRVHGLAVRFAREVARESGHEVDMLTVELGALCHDVVDHKFVRRAEGAALSPLEEFEAELVEALSEEGISEEVVRKVVRIVDGISWSKQKRRGPGCRERFIEMDIVQDADQIEALGAIGVARCFAYGAGKGGKLGDAADHYDEKMANMHNSLDDTTFLTAPGKALAEVRARTMAAFFEEFRAEQREAYDASAGAASGCDSPSS